MRNHELLDEKFEKFQKLYEGMTKKRLDEAVKFADYVSKKLGVKDWVIAKKGTKAGVKPGQTLITNKQFNTIKAQFEKEFPEQSKKYFGSSFKEDQLDEVIQPSTAYGLSKNGKMIEKGSAKKMTARKKELSKKDPDSKYIVHQTSKEVGTMMKDDIGTAYHGKTGSTERFQKLQGLVETYEDDPNLKLKTRIDLLIGELKLNSEGVYGKE